MCAHSMTLVKNDDGLVVVLYPDPVTDVDSKINPVSMKVTSS